MNSVLLKDSSPELSRAYSTPPVMKISECEARLRVFLTPCGTTGRKRTTVYYFHRRELWNIVN
jgi:hypothetical protein